MYHMANTRFAVGTLPPLPDAKIIDIEDPLRVKAGLWGRSCDDREVGRGGQLPHSHPHEWTRENHLERVSVRSGEAFRMGNVRCHALDAVVCSQYML